MYQENKEREIDLKDLCFSLLYQWRRILVITLVIAAVVTGILCYRTLSAEKDEDAMTYEEQVEVYERGVKAAKSNIRKIEKSLDEQNAYMNEAVMMQVNPYKKPQMDSEIAITVEDKKSSITMNAILNMYQNRLTDGSYLEKIAKQQDTKLRYLKKQFTVTGENFDVHETDKSVSIGESVTDDTTRQGVIHIAVSADTIAKAEALYEAMEAEMADIYADVCREYGAHSYKVLQKSSGQVVDTALLDEQQRIRKYITELNTSLTEAQTQLDEMEVPSRAKIEGSLSVKGVLKYILIGVIAGGFVAVCWYGMRYLLKDTVISEEQLQEYFGIRSLGALPKEQKNRLFAGIDKAIGRLEHGKTVLSKEEAYEMIALNIESLGLEDKTIVLTGMPEAEELQEVKCGVEKYLPEYHIQVEKNVIYYASARKAIASGKNVLFVEKIHETRIKDVCKEIEIAKGLKAEVIGELLV